jgi:hypothetical protein
LYRLLGTQYIPNRHSGKREGAKAEKIPYVLIDRVLPGVDANYVGVTSQRLEGE